MHARSEDEGSIRLDGHTFSDAVGRLDPNIAIEFNYHRLMARRRYCIMSHSGFIVLVPRDSFALAQGL